MTTLVSEWPLFRYRGTIRRILDGDSIEVSLDLGDRTYRTRRIRILGYNAPELFTGTQREAGAAARDALALILPVGQRVYIATQLDRESFDRLLGAVYVPIGDRLDNVAVLMIGAGHGIPA